MCLCLLVGLSARPYIKRLQTSFRPHPLITWNESSTCVVLRDGTIKEISMLQLVPGDIVHVSEASSDLTSQHCRLADRTTAGLLHYC